MRLLPLLTVVLWFGCTDDTDVMMDASVTDLGSGVDVGIDDVGFADAAPHDATIADATGEDATGEDATAEDATVEDATAQDAGVPDSGTVVVHTFTEDFTSTQWVASASTTAAIDTQAEVARVPPPFTMLDVGNGSDGLYAPTADGPLAPGFYQFTDVVLDNVDIQVQGAVTMLLTGSFTSSNSAQLTVYGSLTLVVADTVEIYCSSVRSSGLTLHQPSTAGIRIGCTGGAVATLATNSSSGDDTGSIEIFTRGAITLPYSGILETGSAQPPGRAGTLTVRSYGDITLHRSVFRGGDADLFPGDLWIQTEGNLLLDVDSGVVSGHGSFGAGVNLFVGGDLGVHFDSYISAYDAAPLELIVEGSTWLSGRSGLFGERSVGWPPYISVQTRGLTMTYFAYVTAVHGVPNDSEWGGEVSIQSDGDIDLTDSFITAGSRQCDPGGNVVLRSIGDVTVTSSFIRAGESTTDGCTPSSGGNVIIEATGTIQEQGPAPPHFIAGAGNPPGIVSLTPQFPVMVDVDAGLVTFGSVESVALPLLGQPATVSATSLTATNQVFGYLAGDATTPFVLLSNTIGDPLSTGWRYRLKIGARMFDEGTADSLVVQYRSPQ